MGKMPIPVKIAPKGASGKPLDYNDIFTPRKSLIDQSAQESLSPATPDRRQAR
jgi:hypothetical protein